MRGDGIFHFPPSKKRILCKRANALSNICEIQPNFSRFQFLHSFEYIPPSNEKREAHSMQMNECTDTTTSPEKLPKKNVAKLSRGFETCFSSREF